jgi:hypothetical protein
MSAESKIARSRDESIASAGRLHFLKSGVPEARSATLVCRLSRAWIS